MLLILTSKEDLTSDYLIVDLIERGMPYFRLNIEDLSYSEPVFKISNENVERSFLVKSRPLDLAGIKSVWYRRAIHPIPPADLSPSQRIFVAGELRHLAMGMVLNPEILWVNPIDKVSVAENKLFQLQIAKSLGFRIPRTVVSKDSSILVRFIRENNSGTICKPIFHGLFFDGVNSHAIYTRRVEVNDFLDEEECLSVPVLLQEELARQSDLRVTIIGEKCFAAEIRGNRGLVDWRSPDSAAAFTAFNLHPLVVEKCKKMLKCLGLSYGAFDFIREPDGELVFLEVNATGEWAWLEERVGFPMRSAFIELFFGRES